MRDANTSSSYILLCSRKTTKAIRDLYQKTMTTKMKKKKEKKKKVKELNIREHHFNESKEAKTS